MEKCAISGSAARLLYYLKKKMLELNAIYLHISHTYQPCIQKEERETKDKTSQEWKLTFLKV